MVKPKSSQNSWASNAHSMMDSGLNLVALTPLGEYLLEFVGDDAFKTTMCAPHHHQPRRAL
jgi:hypothetical protein